MNGKIVQRVPNHWIFFDNLKKTKPNIFFIDFYGYKNNPPIYHTVEMSTLSFSVYPQWLLQFIRCQCSIFEDEETERPGTTQPPCPSSQLQLPSALPIIVKPIALVLHPPPSSLDDFEMIDHHQAVVI